jgi:hypothetical protein
MVLEKCAKFGRGNLRVQARWDPEEVKGIIRWVVGIVGRATATGGITWIG